MLTLWLFVLWQTGARLDYRQDQYGGFVALRLAPQAGVSWQWSAQGQSVWVWTPGVSRWGWVR
jgi:hypothetical protein